MIFFCGHLILGELKFVLALVCPFSFFFMLFFAIFFCWFGRACVFSTSNSVPSGGFFGDLPFTQIFIFFICLPFT